jgi:hypothetical protein
MCASFSPVKADCAGELGPLDPRLAMLARVAPRSRPEVFQLLNMEGPNGELAPGRVAKGLRCGIEPARSRESKAEPLEVLSGVSSPGDGDLNGLCEGVGLDVFEARDGRLRRPLLIPPGENRDGTVPARARRTEGRPSTGPGCAKSGNPSVGDSGMFSRNGVELPLVGGPPHGLLGMPAIPSCACISRALRNR